MICCREMGEFTCVLGQFMTGLLANNRIWQRNRSDSVQTRFPRYHRNENVAYNPKHLTLSETSEIDQRAKTFHIKPFREPLIQFQQLLAQLCRFYKYRNKALQSVREARPDESRIRPNTGLIRLASWPPAARPAVLLLFCSSVVLPW